GIGAINAGRDITVFGIDGNSDSGLNDTNGTGIASITAGRNIGVFGIATNDGTDASPTPNLSIGKITAGNDIQIGFIISGGDIGDITANGSTDDAGGAGVEGFITILFGAVADGDIGTVTTTGAAGAGGTLSGTFIAYAATATSPIATFVDSNTGTTYTIDVTGPFTSTGILFDIGTANAGTVPNVALMNLAGTTSATNLSITTSDASFVDVIGIDVDNRDATSGPGPGFFSPWPFAAVADPDGNVGGVETEANLGNLKIEGKLGTSDDGGTGYAGLFAGNSPGYIDFDTGAPANNLGDVTSIIIDNGVVTGSLIEVESLGALAIGNLTAVPVGLVQSVEAVITELTNVVLHDPDGAPPTALFITIDVTNPFGEMVVLTGTGAGSTATIDYIDGNDDGVVGGAPAGAAGDGFIVGNVTLPAAGFESTVGVASITETGEGTPLIGFIEVAGPLGTVTLTDSNTTNATPANINSISVGFNIGTIGVDDPVVPADFL
ncbi:MAG: hypothetical protein ACPL1K_04870, partial [Candidatus Kryptoniota bacterium]